MVWKVYLVRCSDNSLYCGITNDINCRIRKHNPYHFLTKN
ncbi:MAG: GIY-YIG nuclease family protein [Candidatus Kariarchaeaceae archaeon]